MGCSINHRVVLVVCPLKTGAIWTAAGWRSQNYDRASSWSPGGRLSAQARYAGGERIDDLIPPAGFEDIMTPDEFRMVGHWLIDWIADYRATVANRPVMARTAPGEVKAHFPATPPAMPEDFEAVFRDLEELDPSRPFALAASQLLRLLPVQFVARQRAGRLSQHGPGCAGAVMAIEPGSHGTGGSGDRLAATDRGPLERMEWSDPGYGLHEHPGRSRLRGSGRRASLWGRGDCRLFSNRWWFTRRTRPIAPWARPRCSLGLDATTCA